jgi:hypothetical protein
VPENPTTDLASTIAQAATEPASATGDNGSATNRPLAELILADQYLAGKTKRGFGFKLGKIVAGGAR